jgi:ATP-dependent protease HslVU (ClpYQ) peptidase subunit
MSVVVVVKKDQEIVIAADTLTTKNGYIRIKSTHKENNSKIVQYKDNFIGSVGSSLVKQMFLQSLYSSKKELSLHGIDNIYRTLLKVHRILKREHYILPQKAGDVESSHIRLLIANSSGIFGVEPDRYVIEYSRFWANGSGGNFALGAMEQAYENHSASEIARIGIEAACTFDKHCDLPMHLHTLKEDLVKTKTKVVEPMIDKKFCDNWCDNVSNWIQNIKNRVSK